MSTSKQPQELSNRNKCCIEIIPCPAVVVQPYVEPKQVLYWNPTKFIKDAYEYGVEPKQVLYWNKQL